MNEQGLVLVEVSVKSRHPDPGTPKTIEDLRHPKEPSEPPPTSPALRSAR
jgi:hypothetical protein